MNRVKKFIYSILGGISIAMGGTVYLLSENKVIGALFFTVGLFTICTFQFYLFTGKVCYVFKNNGRYAFDLIIIWFGNFVGTWIIAQIELFTRIGDQLVRKAILICELKLNDNILSIFILAILCNILIYIAVDGFSNISNDIGKYLALFFGVTIFVICGFEHCVANMYYFSISELWSWKSVIYLLVMTVGNSVGGIIIPSLTSRRKKY